MLNHAFASTGLDPTQISFLLIMFLPLLYIFFFYNSGDDE